MKRILFAFLTLSAFTCSASEETTDTSRGINVEKPVPAIGISGYDLPIVDLDGEAARQIVVDHMKGQYLGHPSTVLLQDGSTMLCVYPKGHGSGAILYKRSEDGGKTWSDRLPNPESWKTSHEVPTLYETVDAKGIRRILLFSGQGPNNRLAISEDNGLSFSELKPIPTQTGETVVMSDLIALKTGPGRYMASYHMDRVIEGKRTFHLYVCFTEDGGLTWSGPVTIHTSDDDAMHLCEGGLVRSPDGSTIAILLRENSRTAPSQIMFTTDEGRTWTKPHPLPRTLWGDRHQVVHLHDGRLLIEFRDQTPQKNKDNALSPTEGDWVGWVGTWGDLKNGGQGEYRIRFKDNYNTWDCAYPAVKLLPDGTIVSITYGHWDKGEQPYILSVRFKIEETDTRARAIRKSGQPLLTNNFDGRILRFLPKPDEPKAELGR